MQKPLLAKMMALAAVKHRGQQDKGGHPYFFHVMAVHGNLPKDIQSEDLECVAVGHDLIEDTNVTAEKLRNMGFNENIVGGILAMTKVKGESYEEYQKKVMANPYSVIAKMADLTHNSDIKRLKGVTDKDIERLAKYARFYDKLKGSVAWARARILHNERIKRELNDRTLS